MAFHEVQFPVNVSQGARGGPRRKTQIVALANGDEERNASWLNSRREYDVAYGVRNADALAAVVAFFEARNGMLYGFRFKDWSDYKSCSPLSAIAGTDQPLGVTDGVTAVFQLAKTYVSGVGLYSRLIAKPVAGTCGISFVRPLLREGLRHDEMVDEFEQAVEARPLVPFEVSHDGNAGGPGDAHSPRHAFDAVMIDE